MPWMSRGGCGIASLLLALSLGAGCTANSSGSDFDASGILVDAGRMGACDTDLDCADRLACTIEHCVSGRCESTPCVDCCDDGLVCDLSLGCVGAPVPCTTDAECRDAVPCTLDRCRDAMFCEHRAQDSLCDAGEVCLAAVGCIRTPPSTCTSPADCSAVGARCIGEWACDPEFGCQFVSALDCDDGDACTIDACIEARAGCVHDPRDDDGDTHPSIACGGGDCADDDAMRYPGATELCDDAIDQDCDSRVDEGCCEVGPCATSCGTTGVRECPSGTCVPPAEVCGGGDDDCDSRVDETSECTPGATRPCTTTCGSMGVERCGAGCTFGACELPSESCNGVDDDCDGEADDGFACVRGATGTCPTACGSTGTRTCAGDCRWDLCSPPAEICNGMDDDCDAACDDGFTCCRGSTLDCRTMGYHAGTAVCRGDCGGYDTAACTNCGNGMRDAGEQCDGVALGGATCMSLGMGFAGGTLRCAPGCVYDTSSCTRCGNSMIDAGEQCDGAMLGGTCASIAMGFGGGTLACTPSCAWNTSGCTRCGNGALDSGEDCDGMLFGGATCRTVPGGFSGGTLRCSPTCRFDTAMCTSWTATGTYAVTPAPAYMCAMFFGTYLVNFNGATMSFADGGSSLTVTVPGLPCNLTGTFSRATRTIDVQCSAAGSCTETYRLVGSFTTDDRWTGTFSATFTGSSCLDCTSRSWMVAGMR